jgi:hypothetical protein
MERHSLSARIANVEAESSFCLFTSPTAPRRKQGLSDSATFFSMVAVSSFVLDTQSEIETNDYCKVDFDDMKHKNTDFGLCAKPNDSPRSFLSGDCT